MSILSDPIDFNGFKKSFMTIDTQDLPDVSIVYPCFNKQKSIDKTAPHSLYYIYSVLKALDIPVNIIFWDIHTETLPLSAITYIHPMFATIEKVLTCLKKDSIKKDSSMICLGNSDQHQHEMCIGGLKEIDVAKWILSKHHQIDLIFTDRNHEFSIAQLVFNMVNNKHIFGDLGCCVYRTENSIHINQHYKYFKINTLPMISLPPNYPEVVRIRSSVGCRAVCTYCIESSSNNCKTVLWMGLPPKRFIDEMVHIKQTFHRHFFNIVDSSFEDSENKKNERINNILSHLIHCNESFSLKIHLRTETINTIDLNILKQSGIDVIITGIESGAQDELKYFNKIASVEVSKKSFIKLSECNLFFVVLGHIMFTPLTTKEYLLDKIQFIHSINRSWDFMSMTNWLLVYWGSKIHNIIKEKNLVIEESPVKYVKYKFCDESVEKIAIVMDKIKTVCPFIMNMHKQFYDTGNILSRFQNPANDHLKIMENDFIKLKTIYQEQQQKVGAIYDHIMLELIDMSDNCSIDQLLDHTQKRMKPVEKLDQDMYQNLKKFNDSINKNKIINNMIFMDTWFSNVNTLGVEVSQ